MRICVGLIAWTFFSCWFCTAVLAQPPSSPTGSLEEPRELPDMDVLSEAERRRLDLGIERGLAWLATKQLEDGSFPSIDVGQPAITALCEMAFIAQGKRVGEGRYGANLQRAIDYIIAQQKPNGLVSRNAPSASPISRRVGYQSGAPGAYNHAISSLVLSENYGQLNAEQTQRVAEAIEKALLATLEMQRWKKNKRENQGGWRYINIAGEADSDLSITGWQLMFLRSARNAGFEVPTKSIDGALEYVKHCYSKQHETFEYIVDTGPHFQTRGMAAAGILAMAHAGLHDSPAAIKAGDWILAHPFDRYNVHLLDKDRYHYGLLQSCQAMYQLGGRHWREFYPRTVKTILDNQRRDGSWPTEGHPRDARFGSAYTTALCVLSLSAANQILPIFQR